MSKIRFDLCDYLIHVFRNVDQLGPQRILFPEHARFNNIDESTVLDSRFLMRCALRHTRIFTTWAYRDGQPTIFGDSPVVCFTSQPFTAWVQSSIKRLSEGLESGGCAFLLPKAAMFDLGARPVIHWLSQAAHEHQDTPPFRILRTDQLPMEEQYRYVAYAVAAESHPSWSQDSEWRWPYRGNQSHFNPDEDAALVETLEEVPGLDLTKLGGIGIVVQDRADISKVIFDILTLVDAGIVRGSTFSFVVALSDLEQHGDTKDPRILSELINGHLLDLTLGFAMSETKAQAINSDVVRTIESLFVEQSHTESDRDDGFGKSWVWILDNGSELVRALRGAGKLVISTEGRYLLDIAQVESFPEGFEEYYCKLIAGHLAVQYDVSTSYFTVRTSVSPNGIPFYANFHDGSHPFYNRTIICD